MNIVKDIKDTTRKATNTVVDTAEKLINIPKSPTELTKRIIEHLEHEEFEEIAQVIAEEAKKYATKMGLDNIVHDQLEELKENMLEVASSAREKDYKRIGSKIKKLEELISERLEGSSEIFKLMKSFFANIRTILEKYEEDNAAIQKKPDFSKIQEVVEEYFSKLIK